MMLACTGLSEDGHSSRVHFSIRVNLACGNVTESFGFRFVGSEGQMTVGLNGLTLAKVLVRQNLAIPSIHSRRRYERSSCGNTGRSIRPKPSTPTQSARSRK